MQNERKRISLQSDQHSEGERRTFPLTFSFSASFLMPTQPTKLQMLEFTTEEGRLNDDARTYIHTPKKKKKKKGKKKERKKENNKQQIMTHNDSRAG